jgi:hypothetical protein
LSILFSLAVAAVAETWVLVVVQVVIALETQQLALVLEHTP